MITGMLDGAAIPIRNTARLREVVNRADAFLNCTAFIWKITSGKITAYKKHLGFCRNVRGKKTHTKTLLSWIVVLAFRKQSEVDGRRGKVLKLNYCAKRDAFKNGEMLMRDAIRGIPL